MRTDSYMSSIRLASEAATPIYNLCSPPRLSSVMRNASWVKSQGGLMALATCFIRAPKGYSCMMPSKCSQFICPPFLPWPCGGTCERTVSSSVARRSKYAEHSALLGKTKTFEICSISLSGPRAFLQISLEPLLSQPLVHLRGIPLLPSHLLPDGFKDGSGRLLAPEIPP